MKTESTLGSIDPGSIFRFGGVQFIRRENAYRYLVSCNIYGTSMNVYISENVWVTDIKQELSGVAEND